MTQRVQIPAWSDQWMQGDRFGLIEKVVSRKAPGGNKVEIAHVRLDISKRLVRFDINDVNPV